MRCPFCAHDDQPGKGFAPDRGQHRDPPPPPVRKLRRALHHLRARAAARDRRRSRATASASRSTRGKIEQSVALACRKRGDRAGAHRPARLGHPAPGRDRSARARSPPPRIGEMVMDGLRQLDTVAYIRFASVYRDFARSARLRGIRQHGAEAGGTRGADERRSSSSSARSWARTSARRRGRCSISGSPRCAWSPRATAGPIPPPVRRRAGADEVLARRGSVRQHRRGGGRLRACLCHHRAQARRDQAGADARRRRRARSPASRGAARCCSGPSDRGWRPRTSRSPGRSSPCRSIPNSARSTSRRR